MQGIFSRSVRPLAKLGQRNIATSKGVPQMLYNNVWKKSTVSYITYIVVGCVAIEVVYGAATVSIWEGANKGVCHENCSFLHVLWIPLAFSCYSRTSCFTPPSFLLHPFMLVAFFAYFSNLRQTHQSPYTIIAPPLSSPPPHSVHSLAPQKLFNSVDWSKFKAIEADDDDDEEEDDEEE